MSQTDNSSVVKNERVLKFSAQQIFSAFEEPKDLAKWWGPKDFKNTFESFEFKPEGRWVYTMHAPNGQDYPGEIIFREIVRGTTLVLEHVDTPWFRLTITLTPHGEGTHLIWNQDFGSPEVAAKMRSMCEPANEQNLDRLQSLLEQK